MHNDPWTGVDSYFAAAIMPDADALEFILKSSAAGGLPAIAVSPAQGKLLHILARSIGARRILEVGTLGGYSAAWLARALPEDGRLITLELEPHHARVARENLVRAGLAQHVEIMVGRALDSLAALVQQHAEPFDLAFIDADKPSNADYFALALRMMRPGGLIIVDNVVRNGAVADQASTDEGVLGVRRLVTAVANEPRVSATVMQTVGSKGYDGLLVGVVLR
jgi:predicted O-methyltransferase YrrM